MIRLSSRQLLPKGQRKALFSTRSCSIAPSDRNLQPHFAVSVRSFGTFETNKKESSTFLANILGSNDKTTASRVLAVLGIASGLSMLTMMRRPYHHVDDERPHSDHFMTPTNLLSSCCLQETNTCQSEAAAAAATVAHHALSNDAATSRQPKQPQPQSQQQHATNQTPSFRVKHVYDIDHVLGEGTYGVVFLARRKTDQLPVALKAMSRKFGTEFEQEGQALRQLSAYQGGHPHICRLYDTHVDDNKCYLALEFIQGGELLDHLIQNGPYSEGQAARYIRQFAEAISFVHEAGYVHADLKLENLLLSQPPEKESRDPTSRLDPAALKVVDFGCAVGPRNTRHQPSATKGNQLTGTVAYLPPEMFRSERAPVTPATDMWAAGCIVYILLTGTHPFDKYASATDDEIAETLEKIEQNPALLNELVFDERTEYLSSSCLSLIEALMHPDPDHRMTSAAFRRHPWVQGMTVSWEKLKESHQNLENLWQKRFRDEILKEFSKSGNKKQLSDRNLAEIFQAMDLDGNGTLELNEIQEFFEKLGFDRRSIADIFDCADLDGTGVIHFDEFRTLMRKKFDSGPGLRLKYRQERFRTDILKQFGSHGSSIVNDKHLRNMFETMDLDGNGVLDAHEIRLVLRATGEENEDVISRIVASVDLNHDGGVSWEEFKEIMRASHEK